MTIQQLRYVVALDTHRHYGRAAQACFVSQPTLSMMVKKLEEELNVHLFNRRHSPIQPTEEGIPLIQQAREILMKVDHFLELSADLGDEFSGDFQLGVIPTISPYLAPLFIDDFLKTYPKLKLHVAEFTTEEIVRRLENNQLDAAILSTPLKTSALREIPLFYEEFYVYSSEELSSDYLLPEDIDPDKLWLLEEGHCFRTQVVKMCEIKKRSNNQLTFHTGNIESLISLVDRHGGLTIVPELSTNHMTTSRKRKLATFAAPAPAREVSLVVAESFYKSQLLEQLESFIIQSIPKYMRVSQSFSIVDVPV